MNEDTKEQQPVNRLDLFYLIGAYNRREISFEEWIASTREWAQAMQQRHGSPITPPQKPVEPD